VQKLGGWQKFYPSPMPTTPRGLHAWEDTNSVSHLAVGNTASTVNNQASLYVITTGVAQNITPQTVTTNPSPTFNTTINSSTVLVTDAGYPGTSASSVFIATPVAIGGLVLSGLYVTTAVSSNSYNITATDILGTPALATATSAVPVLPTFTMLPSSAVVTVVLNNHGYAVGGTFPILLPVAVGLVTLYGNFAVQTVIDANTFTISAPVATPASVAISSIAGNGATVTVNYYGNYVFAAADTVTLSGAAPYNGLHTIASAPNYYGGLGTFTYTDTAVSTFSATGSISGTTVTFTGGVTGTIRVGNLLVGTGITAGTYILSGAGLIWTVNQSQTVASTTISSTTIVTGTATITSASRTVTANNTKANFTYYVYPSPAAPGTGYGIGGYGVGGYGTGTGYQNANGIPVHADDWSLDNLGQILLASPHQQDALNYTITSVAIVAGTATVTFTPAVTVPVGEVIYVSGNSGAYTSGSFNGTYYVATSSTGQVTFTTLATTAPTTLGTFTTYNAIPNPVLQWNPTTGNALATVVPNSPPCNEGFFVAMPQRQIVTYGSSFTGIQDPMLVRWCDNTDYTAWIALATNQAGSFRLTRGSKIVGGLQGPQQGLLWTDLGVWAMQYVGQPYIYQFNQIGSGCGLISRKAAGVLNNVVYWMGPSQFYQLDQNGVVPLLCPVWDVVFQKLDTANTQNIRCAVNSQFSEVQWFFPILGGNGENTNYVKYNALLGQWDYGTLGRSAWINQTVLGPPIGAGPDRFYIYQHETSPDADGAPLVSYYQTGYFVIQEADMQAFVDQVWPDAKWGYYNGSQSATLNLTFYVANYPGQTPRAYGPFTMSQASTYVSPRFRGRLVSIFVGSSDLGSWWRIGNLRYRYMPDGKYG
jgi:hypothetical protein